MTAKFTGYGPSGKKFTTTITVRREPALITRRGFRTEFEAALARAVAEWERMGCTNIKRIRATRSARAQIRL